MNKTSKKTNLTNMEWAMPLGIGICIILAIVFVGLGFWTASWGYQAPRQGADRLTDLGNIGSYLQGTTASLWALAGVLIIFVAFLAQEQQLKLQQRQFNQQSFENHFFQLLTLHRDIVDDLRLKDCSSKGSDVFSVLHRKMESLYEGFAGPIEDRTEALAVGYYETVFNDYPEVLGHYFRTLYHIIKFVNESGTTDKKRYTSIVRAQLSSYEHVLLHYNGLSEYGKKRFKPLIEEYELLENMGPGFLIIREHPTSYLPKAFGEDAPLFVFPQGSPRQT
jgi:Putative phage abortive infection protein